MTKAVNYKGFLIMTAVVAIGGSALLYTQYTSLQEENDRVTTLRGELKNDAQMKQMLIESMDRLKATRERLVHLEKGVPDHAYLATMLTDLAVVGRTYGITISGVAPKARPRVEPKEGETLTPKAYIEQDIEVTGRGSYANVAKFVQSLDKFPKIVATRGMTIVPKVQLGGLPGLDVTIEIRAFLFPQKSTLDKAKEVDHKTAFRLKRGGAIGVNHEG